MFEQFSVATAMSSPTWPVDMPGAVRTHRQGFAAEFFPNPAPASRCREPLAAVAGTASSVGVPPGEFATCSRRTRACTRTGTPRTPGPGRSRGRTGASGSPAGRRGGASSDAGLEHRARSRPSGRWGRSCRCSRSGPPPERWLSNGDPGAARDLARGVVRTSATAPALPFVPTNARCAAWVPLYWQGLLLPVLHCARQLCEVLCVLPVRPIVTVFAPGASVTACAARVVQTRSGARTAA